MKQEGKLTLGSLFAGIGGFELAATWAGITPVWSNEIEPFACKVLTKNFSHEIIQKDIRELMVDNYGNFLHLSDQSVITMGQPKSTKYDDAVSLYESGLSIGECSEFYEISRQAMHKILERRDCVFRSNIKKGTDNHFHRGCMPDNSKKKRVQHLTEKALKKGILDNPKICKECGSSKRFKDGRTSIQAHHSNYDKPLEVIWLCQKCHHNWHKNNQAKNQHDKEKTNEPSGAVDIVSGGFP